MKKLRCLYANQWHVQDLPTTQNEKKASNNSNMSLDSYPKLKNAITCGICMDIFAIPHNLECGHSYCFFCLESWFSKGKNEQKSPQCPCCRHCLTTPPYQNLAMQEFIETIIQTFGQEDAISISQTLKNKMDAFKKLENPWKFMFKPKSLMDEEDGVQRCPFCHWEIVEEGCANCGETFGTEMHAIIRELSMDSDSDFSSDDYEGSFICDDPEDGFLSPGSDYFLDDFIEPPDWVTESNDEEPRIVELHSESEQSTSSKNRTAKRIIESDEE